MSERIAFRMTLNPGQVEEYKRRHDEIWPELVMALKQAGVSDYSIWYDPQSHALFATLIRTSDHKMADLPNQEIVQRWWAMMADIMETHPDNAPVEVELQNVFHMA
ncbi:L-rhamnose mutarotase [Pelagibacterium lentulum]|uniref:L-rhamnose mutarotase n=1 Tax=Pelagibacterium lentulum TaxID=2029865 RepID=A0A916W0H9_9HYPH|nr:L-rhamnose mutarotase [Pelagibacterium lentulum]GGA57066.1 L-rhamnose mutarotase [Pelagibacterium lentulum]